MQTFTRRFLLWLLVPPAVVTLPLGFLFLSQVVQLSAGSAATILGMLVVMFAAGSWAFYRGMAPHLAAVEEAAAGGGSDLSDAMTRVLQRTQLLSVILWFGGGLLFSIAGTLIVLPTLTGFGYFLVAALIGAFPSIAWGYAAAKHQLLGIASNADAVHYTGRELPLGRKIAIVFIGAFILSAAVLVALISSRVSRSLEELAIASAAERFDRIYSNAKIMARVDQQGLDTLREYVPRDYVIHRIDKDGNAMSSGEPLTPGEIRAINRIREGDSSTIDGPHAVRFAQLNDGSVFALSIPWDTYRAIPGRITLYLLVIALFTTAMFIVATYFLARDVNTPLRELRTLARAMAVGNFDAPARVFSDDEVGQLADSFGETRANLRRLLGRVGGSGSTITDGVRVITGGTESLLTHAREQAELTESSSLAVENVRGGIGTVLGAADTVTDLTQDASARALELQASSEEVARSMDYLFQSVEKTSASTTEMNASMTEMSQRTDVLAGIGDEVLSFVAQMDATVEELRATSQATAEISRQVREDAEAGGEAVNKTVEGINASQEISNRTAEALDELQRSVGQISGIVNVIEEITGKTNLLALNAAIIAAQAGEHGLGFTVVADEIRQLAERTRGSTKEIGDIIKAVQSTSKQAVARMHEGVERVTENVELASDAASSLTKIVSSAGRSYEMATRMAGALEDQSKASRHLHEVTSRMSDHISEINRATREQARGTQLLAQEAERVRDIAAQVKNATEEQSSAGRGITIALEKIAEDARAMRDLLEAQLQETDRIAAASRTMLDIAQQNDAIAREFGSTVQNLVRSGKEFESEVGRFRV